MKLLRLLISALVALAITLGLFLFMNKLVSLGGGKRAELDAIAGIHLSLIHI